MEETDNICFVCDQTIPLEKWKYQLQVTATKRRNAPLAELIQDLVGDEFEVLVGEQDAICSKCMNLINLMDLLTFQLGEVKSALTQFLHAKYNLTAEDTKLQVAYDDSTHKERESLHKCEICNYQTKYEKDFNMHLDTHSVQKFQKSPQIVKAEASKKANHGNDQIVLCDEEDYEDIQTLESSDEEVPVPEKIEAKDTSKRSEVSPKTNLDFLDDWVEDEDNDDLYSPAKKSKMKEAENETGSTKTALTENLFQTCSLQESFDVEDDNIDNTGKNMATTPSDVTMKHSRNLCSFTGCGRSKASNPTLRFFTFPVKRPSICDAWVKNCANEHLDTVPKKTLNRRVVCEKHFEISCFVSTRLDASAIPTIFSLQDTDDASSTPLISSTSKNASENVTQKDNVMQSSSNQMLDYQEPLNTTETPKTNIGLCQLSDDVDKPQVGKHTALFPTSCSSNTHQTSPSTPRTPQYKKFKFIIGREQTQKKIMTPGKKIMLAEIHSFRKVNRNLQQKVKCLQSKQAETTVTTEMMMSIMKNMLPVRHSTLSVCK